MRKQKKTFLIHCLFIGLVFLIGGLCGFVLHRYRVIHSIESEKEDCPLVNMTGKKLLDFTCTGMAYDSISHQWLIGDLGALFPGEKPMPQIRFYNNDFSKLEYTIPVYKSVKHHL